MCRICELGSFFCYIQFLRCSFVEGTVENFWWMLYDVVAFEKDATIRTNDSAVWSSGLPSICAKKANRIWVQPSQWDAFQDDFVGRAMLVLKILNALGMSWGRSLCADHVKAFFHCSSTKWHSWHATCHGTGKGMIIQPKDICQVCKGVGTIKAPVVTVVKCFKFTWVICSRLPGRKKHHLRLRLNPVQRTFTYKYAFDLRTQPNI